VAGGADGPAGATGSGASLLTSGSAVTRGLLAVLAEVSAVLVAVQTLLGDVAGLGELIDGWPAWAKWLLVAVLAVIGIALALPYLKWFFRRSRLQHPEAFRLNASDPTHLVGRDEDIAAVEQACLNHPLVWLTGESGVGKSALVRAGLVPRFSDGGRLLPIYLDTWGRDWERSPRLALRDALWATLGPEEKAGLGLERSPPENDLAAILGRIREALARPSLLIFDQFDDYQARHRARFLPGRRRTWLRAEELIKANGFWREVADLVRHDIVHALFITRDDTAIGLETVRFVEPERLTLFRLPPVFVSSIFDRIASANGNIAVILDPDRGWAHLKRRLGDDLSGGEAVLPQQVKTVLLGLRHPTLAHGEELSAGRGAPGRRGAPRGERGRQVWRQPRLSARAGSSAGNARRAHRRGRPVEDQGAQCR
jgi:hypothetical protein